MIRQPEAWGKSISSDVKICIQLMLSFIRLFPQNNDFIFLRIDIPDFYTFFFFKSNTNFRDKPFTVTTQTINTIFPG